jgi:uncharacterized protein
VTASPEIAARAARLANLPLRSVEAAVALIDDGCTIPFIARYRKDATGGLGDGDLRRLEERIEEARAFVERRASIRAILEKAGKLTPDLDARLAAAATRQELEDLYEPFKERRRTKASAALERGLGPLADRLADPGERGRPEDLAAPFVSAEKGVGSVEEALAGAADIIVDRIATDPEVRKLVRESRAGGTLVVRASRGKSEEAARSVYRELVGLRASVRSLRPHRVLAVNRGEREGPLSVSVEGDREREERGILRKFLPRPGRPADACIREAAARALDDRVGPAGENDVRRTLTEDAEARSIDTFRENLRQLLLSPPLKRTVILGVDPGFSHGLKCAAIDACGAFLAATTIHPNRGHPEGAAREVRALVEKLRADLVAIGNGTGSREAARFVRDALRDLPGGRRVQQAIVSEAGASIYSASEEAAEEHPDLDVEARGALSIARRVQDPLAELVKIDPWHLGVGQYQHDLDEGKLRKALDGVVEAAVNEVGVDLNRASPALLRRVSGIGPRIARAIVERRKTAGPFRSRADLREVAGIGAKAFEQAAGFLRVPESSEPLDRTAVHPESYGVARRIAAAAGRSVEEIAGHPEVLQTVDPARFAEGPAGVEAVRDILRELAQPGRDPRGEAASMEYTEGVESIEALRPGMTVSGTVTNLADFGAFVDIGVHRDGLIHVSRLGRRVGHPSEVLRLGQRVRAKVEAVDLDRQRISLSLEA